MPRWFRWRGRIWHLRVHRDRRDQWVGRFLPEAEIYTHVHHFLDVGWNGSMQRRSFWGTIRVRTVYVCPLPTLVINLWRYES